MDHQKRSLRIGAAVILCGIFFRLLSSGVLRPTALELPELASFLLYLETGRVIHGTEPAATTPPTVPETTAGPTVPATDPPQTLPPVERPAFTAADAGLISLRDHCNYQPDLASLLERPLDWDLTGEAPTVLILHTHTTESYTPSPGENYQEAGEYRTLDESFNMICVGDRLAETLEAGGIAVLHDRKLHDYPSYNGSYEDSRASIAEFLKEYPSIRLVLDLHRDAADDGYGGQMDTRATVDGVESAQLMLVVGTDAGGLTHPNWRENLALAAKLQVWLEKQWPGLCRPISFRSQRFNQDQSPGALLVEVGAAGNTRQEALTAAEALAKAILALSHGSE